MPGTGPYGKDLGAAVRGEGKLRTIVVEGLLKYFQSPDVPLPVRLLIIVCLFAITAYSILVTILIVNALLAVFGHPMYWNFYLAAFGVITLFLFGTFFLLLRRVVEFDEYQRKSLGFAEVARARRQASRAHANNG